PPNRRQHGQETTRRSIPGREVADRAGRHQERERLGDVSASRDRSESVLSLEVGHKPDKLQMGTWIEDRLCSQLDKAKLAKKSSRIFTLDMSEGTRRTTQQFDGTWSRRNALGHAR